MITSETMPAASATLLITTAPVPAGVLVMETLENALQRGQKPIAEIAGFGASGDAHHVAHPPPDGAGATFAMQRALADSHMSPAHVAYVNAHATSTPVGDATELAALKTVRTVGEPHCQLVVQNFPTTADC